MKEIKKYEKELEQLLDLDKNNWSKFYVLMKQIEEKELYKELGLKSFTAWVKDFCMKHKVHESVIWNRKKAGKVYEKYSDIQKSKGIEVAPIEKAAVGVDALVLLDKISKKDENLGAELTEKAINREITREDLRDAYKVIRGDIVKKKHSKLDNSGDIEKAEENKEDNVTATKIVGALNDSAWLGRKCEKKHFRGVYERDKYKTITEFPVYTGTSSISRRIDVLAVENLRVEDHFSLNLHAIEIKVSKSDLENDMKYTEYAEFVNYLWLAIPEELLEVAEINAPGSVGIMCYKDNTMIVHREAEALKPLSIQESLTTLTLRLL